MTSLEENILPPTAVVNGDKPSQPQGPTVSIPRPMNGKIIDRWRIKLLIELIKAHLLSVTLSFSPSNKCISLIWTAKPTYSSSIYGKIYYESPHRRKFVLVGGSKGGNAPRSLKASNFSPYCKRICRRTSN